MKARLERFHGATYNDEDLRLLVAEVERLRGVEDAAQALTDRLDYHFRTLGRQACVRYREALREALQDG